MGEGFCVILYIAVGVIVEEDDCLSCLEEVDEILDFLLAFVLKHPVIGWDIDLLSCLNVFKELSGTQSFLMAKASAMGPDGALEVLHRAVGETTEVYPFVFKDFESLPDALNTGGGHSPGKWYGDSPVRIKWREPFILYFAGHVEDLSTGIRLENVLNLASFALDYDHNKLCRIIVYY